MIAPICPCVRALADDMEGTSKSAEAKNMTAYFFAMLWD